MKQWHVHGAMGEQMYIWLSNWCLFDMSMNLHKFKSKQLYLKGMCFVEYASLEELKHEKIKRFRY